MASASIIFRPFLQGLFYLVLRGVMSLPFNNVRIAYLRIVGATIGRNVFIGRRCEIKQPRNLVIGNHTVINPRVLLDARGGTLKIGDNVDIALESILWTETHDPQDDYHKTINLPTTVEDYCWIGCRSMIMPGVKIEYGAVIAAGAIVTKDVAAKTIVAGVPAKQIGIRTSALKYLKNYCPYFY